MLIAGYTNNMYTVQFGGRTSTVHRREALSWRPGPRSGHPDCWRPGLRSGHSDCNVQHLVDKRAQHAGKPFSVGVRDCGRAACYLHHLAAKRAQRAGEKRSVGVRDSTRAILITICSTSWPHEHGAQARSAQLAPGTASRPL